jgi:hypothetical protein
MGIGGPGHREQVLVFYVDKRELMIVFVDVVAVLARVVAEVDLRAWQTVGRVPCFFSPKL